MRLSSLSLRNFRGFAEHDIPLDGFTLFVGPNDAGKSTILDAVRCLMHPRDRFGRNWDWDHVVTLTRQVPPLGLDYVPLLSMWDRNDVVVVGRFSDLTPTEGETWGWAIDGGVLTLGVFFVAVDEAEPSSTRSDLHVIVTDERFQQHAGDLEHWPIYEPLRDNGYRGGRLTSSRFDDGRWIPAGAFLEGLNRELLMSWGGLPQREVDVEVRRLLPDIVAIPGPEVAPPEPANVLAPLMARKRNKTAGELNKLGISDQVLRTVSGALEGLSDRWDSIVPRYLDGATGGTLWHRNRRLSLWDPVIDAAFEGPKPTVRYPMVGHEPDDPEVLDAAYRLQGAGARRAILMSLLELYLDPEEWDPSGSLIVILEEPEVGLHPAAQRHVAAALRKLSRSGVQVLLSTHSPVLVNEVPAEAIRLVRAGDLEPTDLLQNPIGVLRSRSITKAGQVAEVAHILGAQPSDALLGQRFVVVEGNSDAAIFKTWAHRMGVDLDAKGIRLYPAGGSSKVENLAKFLEVAYSGATFHVLLDSGRDTRSHAEEMRERFGDRVDVRLLGRSEIEAYFSRPAVRAWLASQGVSLAQQDEAIEAALVSELRKRLLQEIADRFLGRRYRVVEDGVAIAGHMSEGEIPPEIRGLITQLAD